MGSDLRHAALRAGSVGVGFGSLDVAVVEGMAEGVELAELVGGLEIPL